MGEKSLLLNSWLFKAQSNVQLRTAICIILAVKRNLRGSVNGTDVHPNSPLHSQNNLKWFEYKADPVLQDHVAPCGVIYIHVKWTEQAANSEWRHM